MTWDDILWAAVTVGRPDRYHVFQHGDVSGYEALFRWSLIRMALEQRGPSTCRLTRTDAANTLDPTEKGMVSYFLGMTFCKLFADKLLHTPWVFHLDLLRSELKPLLSGWSRPDLIGLKAGSNRWHGFECKGRSSPPSADEKNRAKTQVERLGTVDFRGFSRSLLVAAITYFQNDVLQFYWCDAPPQDSDEIVLNLPDDAWRHYYSPVVEVITASDSGTLGDLMSERVEARIPSERDGAGNLQVPIAQCDLEIGVHRAIRDYLVVQDWHGARHAASEAAREIGEEGFQADGLRVLAYDSWNERVPEAFRS